MRMFQSQLIILFVPFSVGLPYLTGWNHNNLHCRDNDNKPVDWWYIYKPPGFVIPYAQYGRNFSYITPDTEGKWVPSPTYINGNSMLQNTLSPMFRQTYVDYLAMVAYDQSGSSTLPLISSSLGLMMADDQGGVWIGHTVPGFPDITKDRPIFPHQEGANGHLLVCLSLGLVSLNEVAVAIRKVKPAFIQHRIPRGMERFLPMWKFDSEERSNKNKIHKTVFSTKDKTILVALMARSAGDNTSLYKKFAKENKIILDVYGSQKRNTRSFCTNDYGVRNINLISLKHPDEVIYINKGVDKSKFAVSTAASWQRRGRAENQYWTCISNLDAYERSNNGGLLMCVADYRIWVIFDNFKIKEPDC